MKVSFEHLNNLEFHITKIAAMNQHWTDNFNFTMTHPRPTDALLYCCGCDAKLTYKAGDEILLFQKGALCLIPHGSVYTWTFCNEHNGREISCMLFEFLLKTEDGEILELAEEVKCIDDCHEGWYKRLYAELINEFARPQVSHPRLFAAAFSLLAAASDLHRANVVSSKNFRYIYEGLKYLEEDPRQEKTVAEIAEMCNVSINYFERLFKEYSGMTPVKYRRVRKCDRAKVMLENTVLSLEQIAEELTFNDCAYFCRSFKKICGMSPAQYRKRHAISLF